MRHRAVSEQGAALLTVLLFMVILLIFVTAMLTISGNEILVSAMHRDAVLALEYAQSGIEEAVRRYEGGRGITQPFVGSLAPGITVRARTIVPGASGGIIEMQSDATVRTARRRLSLLATVVSGLLPPNVMFGYSFAEQGNAASVETGDVYSQTFTELVDVPDTNPDGTPQYVYSGWAAIKREPASGYSVDNPCYTQQNCESEQTPTPAKRWYAGHRRGAHEDVTFAVAFQNASSLDTRKPKTVLGFECPTATPPAGIVSDRSEYDETSPNLEWRADTVVDDDPALPNAHVIDPNLPLYGCSDTSATPPEDSESLPYTWVREQLFVPEDFVPAKWRSNNPTPGPVQCNVDDPNPSKAGKGKKLCEVRLWFKTIPYTKWFNQYWELNSNQTSYQKNSQLLTNPQYGAVPPFPPIADLLDGPDDYRIGGGVINSSSGIDFGTCQQGSDGVIDTCDGSASYQRRVVLDCSPPGSCSYTVNGSLDSNDDGHGLLIVNGDLFINGGVDYWGTVIVNGKVTLGSGTVRIYGGLVARSTAYVSGNITVRAGSALANMVIGRAKVTRLSWWER